MEKNSIFSTAKWIGRAGVCGNEPTPAPLLRKRFVLNKEVKEATIYVSGLGQYEGFVNGRRLDESIVFAPTISDYTKTVYYNQYDVTDKLVTGENVLAFALGRGRYAFHTPHTPWDGEKAAWVDAVKMIAVLEVMYQDGSSEQIMTDADWEAKASAVVRDCMYEGEDFDVRLYDPEWNLAVPGSGWEPCRIMEAPMGVLTYDEAEPIRICERLKPVSCTRIREKVFVFGFENYVTGWLELKLVCPRDTVVKIQYAERVDEKGEVLLEQSVTEERLQRDYVISSGEPFTYEPRFSYKGFYYVQVEGVPELTVEDAVACYIHNDVSSVNSFSCSDDMINWFHHAFRRTVLSNLQGVTSDTPVFEKLGWTGDANAVAPAVLMNFDMRLFYRKWLRDFKDSQLVTGEIPPIIPTTGWGLTGADGWKEVQGPVPSFDICYPELVYRVYWCYDEKEVLEEHYDALKKYAAYLTACSGDGLFTKGLGDWLPPTGDTGWDYAISPEGPALIAGAFHIRIYEFMQKIAAALGLEDDAKAYEAERERLIRLYHEVYFDSGKQYYQCERYDGFRQAPNVLALAFGIVPKQCREAVLQHLLEDLKQREYHHCMGIMTVQHLLQVLTEAGYHEIAYRVLTAKGYPGWDYLRENGLKSLTEAWECKVTRSFCHYAMGASEYWILTRLAGVEQLEAGYKKVRIRPMLPKGMDFVEMTLDTVNGRIRLKCERRDGQLVKTVQADDRIEVMETSYENMFYV